MRPRGIRGDPEHYAGMQRLADLVHQYKNICSYKFPVWFKEVDVIGVEEDVLVPQIVESESECAMRVEKINENTINITGADLS